MPDIPRLNGVIKALEQGKVAFTTFSPTEVDSATAISAAPYDGVPVDFTLHAGGSMFNLSEGLRLAFCP